MKRPWIVKERQSSHRTEKWAKWRTRATYKTFESAQLAADKLKLLWTGLGYRCETEISERPNPHNTAGE